MVKQKYNLFSENTPYRTVQRFPWSRTELEESVSLVKQILSDTDDKTTIIRASVVSNTTPADLGLIEIPHELQASERQL